MGDSVPSAETSGARRGGAGLEPPPPGLQEQHRRLPWRAAGTKQRGGVKTKAKKDQGAHLCS